MKCVSSVFWRVCCSRSRWNLKALYSDALTLCRSFISRHPPTCYINPFQGPWCIERITIQDFVRELCVPKINRFVPHPVSRNWLVLVLLQESSWLSYEIRLDKLLLGVWFSDCGTSRRRRLTWIHICERPYDHSFRSVAEVLKETTSCHIPDVQLHVLCMIVTRHWTWCCRVVNWISNTNLLTRWIVHSSKWSGSAAQCSWSKCSSGTTVNYSELTLFTKTNDMNMSKQAPIRFFCWSRSCFEKSRRCRWFGWSHMAEVKQEIHCIKMLT
jgi:hypothetical protein